MSQIKKNYIKVGMTASLTGRYSHMGSQALAGVQAWVEDTNSAGGLWVRDGGGRLPARLVHYDDASLPQQCAELTERLIVEDGVDILLGPYSSGLALEAASVAWRHKRLLWNHGGALEAIYEVGGGWVVGILTPASRYFHPIIDMAVGTAPTLTLPRFAGEGTWLSPPPRSGGGSGWGPYPQSLVVIHSTAGAFPKEVASGAERYARERGFQSIAVLSYRLGTADFSPIIERLKVLRPDLVLAVGRIEDDVRFAQQLAASGIEVGAVGLIAAPLALFRDALGDAAEGFLGPSQWEPGLVGVPDYGPASDEVVRSLARASPSVDYPMAQAYAGCLVAQRCIEDAGTLDNAALRRAAARLDFTTFYGRFIIEPATGRQLGHQMPVVQWHGGAKRVVWPLL